MVVADAVERVLGAAERRAPAGRRAGRLRRARRVGDRRRQRRQRPPDHVALPARPEGGARHRMTDVDRLLRGVHRRGPRGRRRRPGRVPGAGRCRIARAELAALIDGYLARAPRRAFDRAAFEASPARAADRRVARWRGVGDVAGAAAAPARPRAAAARRAGGASGRRARASADREAKVARVLPRDGAGDAAVGRRQRPGARGARADRRRERRGAARGGALCAAARSRGVARSPRRPRSPPPAAPRRPVRDGSTPPAAAGASTDGVLRSPTGEDVEERAEAVLAALPSYVWDGERLPVPVEDIADSGSGCSCATSRTCTAPGAPLLTTASRCPASCSQRAARSGSTPPRRGSGRRGGGSRSATSSATGSCTARPAGALLPPHAVNEAVAARSATSRRRRARSRPRC